MVDIEVAVAVDVDQTNAGIPAIGSTNAGGFGGQAVVDLVASFSKIKLVGYEVAAEVKVGQAIVIKVTGRHATTVVEVPVFEDVEIGGFFQLIEEADAGFAVLQAGEQRIVGRLAGGEAAN